MLLVSMASTLGTMARWNQYPLSNSLQRSETTKFCIQLPDYFSLCAGYDGLSGMKIILEIQLKKAR